MQNSEDERYRSYMRMEFTGYNSIMQSLQSVSSSLSSSDDMELLQSLGQLSSDLAIAHEDFLATIPLPQIISLLIECLHKEHMPDIPLYAMNCLVSIVDSLPHASGIIVTSGGIQVLAAKLLNFEFIDLAEHSIKVLEKISIEHAMAIVKEGAFDTMINTMDFFESSVQKRILTIAVNIGKNLNNREALDKVLVVLPIFIGLLEYRGTESLMQNEKSLDFLSAVTDNVPRVCARPEEAAAYFYRMKDLGIVGCVVELISTAQSLLVKAVKLLRYLNKHSAEMCCDFLSMGGSDVIKNALSTPFENMEVITEILRLASAVIPAAKSENPIEMQKINIFNDRPQYLKALTEMILPRSIAMYEELVSNESKLVVVEILEKIIQLSPAEELIPYVSPQSFSTFISEILNSKEYRMVENALKIVNVLYDKAIDAVSSNFIREGVLHRVSLFKDPSTIRGLRPPKDPHQNFPPVLRKFFSHSDMETSERQLFEELMQRIRGQNLESPSEILPPLFSSTSAESRVDYQQSLIALTKTFLDKHRSVESKEALQPGKELAKIVKKLDGCSGETAYEVLNNLQRSLSNTQRFSYYEVCNSKLAEVLLKWLTNAKEKKLSEVSLKRINEFLTLFLKESASGESYLSILVGLLLGAIQYVQQFNISISGSNMYSSRKLSQKYRVQFVYCPDPDTEAVPAELVARHNLFMTSGHFSIIAGQYTCFDAIKQAILSAKTGKDLGFLKDYFKNSTDRRMRMEYLGEYSGDEEFNEFSEGPRVLSRDPGENKNITISMNINGMEISKGMTMFEAFSSSKTSEGEVVKFKLCMLDAEKAVSENLQSLNQVFSAIVNDSLKVGIESKSKALPYLSLLKLLYNINDTLAVFLPQLVSSGCLNKLPLGVFKSSKLTSLLLRQIQEQHSFLQALHPRMATEAVPISGSVPTWIRFLPKTCRFLFPYTVREDYLYSFTIRIPVAKHKHRIQRDKLLENAIFLTSDTALLKQHYLEIDYEGEVGTGIGPSLEFFSLVSDEIRKLQIWRRSEDSSLFPLPLQSSCPEWKDYFTFCGRFVAKALLDKRQIDLPFSPVFWKLVLNEPITLVDLLKLDKGLGQTMLDFQELSNKYKLRKTKPSYKGTSIENLSLNFTLPGFENIELKPLGKMCGLSIENMEEYVSLVTSYTLLQTAQAGAFREGFEEVIPISALELFNGEELEDLLCGQVGSQWKMADLQENVNPAHGFNPSSPVFHNLLITMSEFSLNEQRKFLQFITGSHRLPVGGFAALSPRLTVVRKEPSMPGIHPDEYLPSVMTCQNYLKLPEYSCIEALQRNLKYAIVEGHESFHLS